ncbi:hypothetical protein EV643_13423 [Kribbella sp. VKM Ac-2527]|uniref:Uncharacterized protein n=1 Tax=Kribbella caucasensis TaxID=2512215 RepID=A0A4R6J6B2_9ACTN|nr:hypothetical protein [Kribbella sp. VKM Ac-2527]TDO30999.1 hypothetical protein EV643_13423 [Kribbella sp. VKM Ac-2527]
MATDKGAKSAARSKRQAPQTSPTSNPESLAPTGHDADFAALVQHVAAELPSLEEAQGPFPWPPMRRSGVYTRITTPLPTPNGPLAPDTALDGADGATLEIEEAIEGHLGPRPVWVSEELRVDVDGTFPTMTISGTIFRLFGGWLTWIARVTEDPQTGEYVGPISYRNGAAQLLQHTDVRCRLTGSPWIQPGRHARVTFTGGGLQQRVRVYRFVQSNFRTVGIEYDTVEGTNSVTSYNLQAHPNRPADLPATTLTIEDVFTRQGLRMTKTSGEDVIPIDEAMGNQLWSDLEMHDAMQQHWSKFADVPQWQLWTLFAGRHEMGFGLGGIMFDDIGTAQRQGCAIFMDSFISNPAPAGDPAAAAYVQRMRFWTAVHEIGHTFNLAHSWQKDLGTPWIPLVPAPEERSFMNYPFRVAGGPNAFFADFHYRFSEDELLFLRHAPARFVQQGNAPWFDQHGFEQARMDGSAALTLTVRFNRAASRFEALEPIVAEIKLTNTSPVAIVVDKNALISDQLLVVIEGKGKGPRQWIPYQRYCTLAEPQILQPAESMYAPLYLSAGLNGFDLADPGRYRVYAALRTAAGDVLSAPLDLHVARFESREQESLADDIFEDEVGRVLAYDGSRVLERACATLREVVDRTPESRIAKHAAAALGRVAATSGLVLEEGDGTPQLVTRPARPEEAAPLLDTAYGDLDTAADTFGHIRLTEEVTRTAQALAKEGNRSRGAEMTGSLAQVLDGRGVLPRVVAEVRGVAHTLSE